MTTTTTTHCITIQTQTTTTTSPTTTTTEQMFCHQQQQQFQDTSSSSCSSSNSNHHHHHVFDQRQLCFDPHGFERQNVPRSPMSCEMQSCFSRQCNGLSRFASVDGGLDNEAAEEVEENDGAAGKHRHNNEPNRLLSYGLHLNNETADYSLWCII